MENDCTFGVRLLSFLQDFYPSVGKWDQMEIEEYEYLCRMACMDIQQKFNDEQYRWYFNNLVKDCTTPDEFINKYFDRTFVEKELKDIKYF